MEYFFVLFLCICLVRPPPTNGQAVTCRAVTDPEALVSDEWCSSNCFSGGVAQTIENLQYYCTTGSLPQLCTCAVASGVGTSGSTDCLGFFEPTSDCSLSCGSGVQTLTFRIVNASTNGGLPCTNNEGDTVTDVCNTQPCGGRCESFTAFGSCSEDCSGGVQSRTAIGSPCGLSEGSTQFQTCNQQPCSGPCPPEPSGTLKCQFCEIGGQCYATNALIECVGGKKENFGCPCPDESPCQHAADCTCLSRQSNGNCPPGTCDCWRYRHTALKTCIGCPCVGSPDLPCIHANDRHCMECNGGAGTEPCVGCWEGQVMTGIWYPVGFVSSTTGQICTSTGWTSCSPLCVPSVDCVGNFTASGPCSGSCDNGIQTEVFTITKPASNGGIPCPYTGGFTRTSTCALQPCAGGGQPIDCVGSFVPNGLCSASCGSGIISFTFLVTTAASNGGMDCPFSDGYSLSAQCATQPCAGASQPIDCIGQWLPSTGCSATCGGGQRTATFVVLVSAANGGADCLHPNGFSQTESCNTQSCEAVVNCQGSFVPLGECNVLCGGGQQLSSFVITVSASNGGTACTYPSGYTRTQSCNTQACAFGPQPTDCVGEFIPSGSCSASCGGGVLLQTFTISTPASNGGIDCPFANGYTMSTTCNTEACVSGLPINCIGTWGCPTCCSATCGSGFQTQTFRITTPAANGGSACEAVEGATRTISCNTQPCGAVVPCQGSFVPLGGCSATCGGGSQIQSFTITQTAKNGGAQCLYPCGFTQSIACNTQPCAPGQVNCIGSFQSTSCSASCGGGSLTRTFHISVPASNGGADCLFSEGYSDTQSCNTQTCPSGPSIPVNCVGSFTEGSCSASCGGGLKTLTFHITTPASNGGMECSNAEGDTQTQPCNTQACPSGPSIPINCVGQFTPSGICSKSCDGGVQTFVFVITTFASNGGLDCLYSNGFTMTGACNTEACGTPINCVGSFMCPTCCSATCGGGTHTVTFLVTQPASSGGIECPFPNGFTRTEVCNTQPCAAVVNCEGSFVQLSQCSVSCGGGIEIWTFVITVNAANGGTQCAFPAGYTKSQLCNSQTCPGGQVNCLGAFEQGNCSVTCGGGSLIETFKISVPAANGGLDCQFAHGFTRTSPCNTQTCPSGPLIPVNCVGSFTEGSCSASCGGGLKTLTFHITTPASNGGMECSNAEGDTQTQPCNTQTCPSGPLPPVNCVGEFVPANSCSQSCGGGVQIFKFVISTPASNGGTECPFPADFTISGACNTEACGVPIDCEGTFGCPTCCSATCGGGTRTVTFIVTRPAAFGGKECPFPNGFTRTEVCNTQPCAEKVNCEGSFVRLCACSATCGGGFEIFTFQITKNAANGGTECPFPAGFLKTEPCNTEPCVTGVNCQGAFEISNCSVTCGGGSLIETFKVTVEASNGGQNCSFADGFTQSFPCNVQSCPQGPTNVTNCVGELVPSPCPVSCDGGVQVSTFVISVNASNGGDQCAHPNGFTETAVCNTEPCPINCHGNFVEGNCSVTCGGGILIETFKIDIPAAHGGSECEHPDNFTRSSACNTEACGLPVNCTGHFVLNSSCSANCSGVTIGFALGTEISVFVVDTPASNGGQDCDFKDGDTISAMCNISCPFGPGNQTNCVGHPENVGGCSAKCTSNSTSGFAEGIQVSVFIVDIPASGGGQDCDFPNGTTSSTACNVSCAVNCSGHFEHLGNCSAECTNSSSFALGSQLSIFVIDIPALNGGEACAFENGSTISEACNISCPFGPGNKTNCIGHLEDLGNCTISQSSECVNGSEIGVKLQVFIVDTPASNGGEPCDFENGTTISSSCNVSCALPVNCTGHFELLGNCSAECTNNSLFGFETGVQLSIFIVDTPAQNGGSCPHENGTTISAACNITCNISTCLQFDTDRGNGCGNSCRCPNRNSCLNGTAKTVHDCVWIGPDDATGECLRILTGPECNTCPEINPGCGHNCNCPNLESCTSGEAKDNCVWTGIRCERKDCTPINCSAHFITLEECSPNCTGHAGEVVFGVGLTEFIIDVNGGRGGILCPYENGTTFSVSCNETCPSGPGNVTNCVGHLEDLGNCTITESSVCVEGLEVGVKIQVFIVDIPASNGGESCELANGTTISVACNLTCPAPVNCSGHFVPGECVPLTNCSNATETLPGTITSYFVIDVNASNNGEPCEFEAGATISSPCNSSCNGTCTRIDTRGGNGCGNNCNCPNQESCLNGTAKTVHDCVWVGPTDKDGYCFRQLSGSDCIVCDPDGNSCANDCRCNNIQSCTSGQAKDHCVWIGVPGDGACKNTICPL